MEVLDDDREGLRRSGEIEDPVASCTSVAVPVLQHLFQAVIALCVLECSGCEIERGCKAFHVVESIGWRRENSAGGFTQARPQLFRSNVPTVHSDDGYRFQQRTVNHQVVQGLGQASDD